MRPALALALLALLSVIAVVRSGAPAPKALDAPSIEFSAERARQALLDALRDGAPHPTGTAANDRVRERLAKKLAAMGYDVERPSGFVCSRSTCATVTDLLVRIPGRIGANAVVLTAHYDSVAAGPGASDDGMGVATVLEAARAIRAAPALRRPVWLLLTDGEELGLLGAKALVRNSILTGQVGVVVNVEARGTSGPSLMFETSPNNAGLVHAFATSTDHAVTSSLFPALYSLLPNDTDLSVYRAAGIAGLNYAVIGGAGRYHTPADDLAHVDLGSLQHQGDNALAMVRALADGASSTTAGDDLVFFDCLGAFVVRWPARATLPIALGLIAMLAACAMAAVKRRLLTPASCAFGVLGALAVPVAGAVGLAASAGLRALGAAPAPWVAHPAAMILASCALGALAAASVVMVAARSADAAGLWWGTATVLGTVGAVVSVRLPGVAFLFLVPAAWAGVGLVAWAFGRAGPARREWLAVAMPATAVLVWTPPLGLLYDALGSRFLPLLAAGTGLVVWTAAPAIASLARRERTLLLSALGLVSVGALALAPLLAPFDADVPAHASMRWYAADGQARTLLFAPDGAPEALARMFRLRESAWPWSREVPSASAAGAPDVPEPAPTLEVVSSTVTPPLTRIVVKLKSARAAAVVGLAVRPGDDLRSVSMHGEALTPPEPVSHRAAPWASYECVTTPPGGIDLELTLPTGQPLVAYVFDKKPGLPPGEPGKLRALRAPEAVAYGAGDYSLVARRVTLP